MNTIRIIPFITLSLLLIPACADQEEGAEAETAETSAPALPSMDPPTVEEARELLEGSQPLAQYKFSQAAITIPMRSQMLGERMREAIKDLDATGWIGYDSEGNVAISTKAMSDKRFILRQGDTLEIVPVASKRFGEVLDVGVENGEPYIDFSWYWEPNEIGAAFQSGYFYERYNSTYYARARLIEGADEWKIYTIEEIEPPTGTTESEAESSETTS